ncbi:MAG: GatB/YqeY domain-containing protein [Gemmatimonadota bacterium]
MAESLKVRIRADLNTARKARDKHRTMLLTTILSDIKNREIELIRDATDAEVTEVVTRGIKRRKEAAEQMRAGSRNELAEKEEEEARLLAAYLPEQLTEADVRAYIREAIAGGLSAAGPIMGKIAGRIKGRFDGKEANRLVQEELLNK